MVRSPARYQPGTTIACQPVLASASTSDRFGSLAPLVRGRPIVPGGRGGAGAVNPAAGRRRGAARLPPPALASRETRARGPPSPTPTRGAAPPPPAGPRGRFGSARG